MNTIWIIGANSDIASAYLKILDEEKNRGVSCLLCSRHPENLAVPVQNMKFLKGRWRKLDVADNEDIDSLLKREAVPDVVIFTSGVLEKTKNGEKNDIDKVFSANAVGAIKILDFILPKMAERGTGAVVGLSSIAGERGKSSNPVYCASKAAFSIYLEGIMQQYSRQNVSIILVKPGFVWTKMLMESGKHPAKFFTCSPELVAGTISKAVKQRKSKIIFVLGVWRIIMWLYCRIPLFVYLRMKGA